MNEHQIQHVLKLTELALKYVCDCDGDCTNCQLGSVAMAHTDDLPELPQGLNLCALFDYVTQTIEINEAPKLSLNKQ